MAEETTQPRENQPSEQPAPEKSAEEKPTGESAAAKPETKSKEQVKAEASSSIKQVAVDEQVSIWMSRSNFSSQAAFFAFVASMLIGSLRFMFPRVLFEPSPVFKAGYPDDSPVGSVSTIGVKEQRVWIVRDDFRLLELTSYLDDRYAGTCGCYPIRVFPQGRP